MRSFLSIMIALLIAAPAAAQVGVPELTPEQEQTAQEAMRRLRSPVTPFHTVDMCPSTQALRDTIRMAVARGEARDEIVEGVIARYGEQVRLLPKRSGPGLLAWVATPLVLLLGAGLILSRLRRARGATSPGGPTPELSDAERERVAAALARWEESGEVEP